MPNEEYTIHDKIQENSRLGYWDDDYDDEEEDEYDGYSIIERQRYLRRKRRSMEDYDSYWEDV